MQKDPEESPPLNGKDTTAMIVRDKKDPIGWKEIEQERDTIQTAEEIGKEKEMTTDLVRTESRSLLITDLLMV